MPSQPTAIDIRLTNISTCLNAALSTLEAVYTGLKTPFLGHILNTMRSLLNSVMVNSTDYSLNVHHIFQTIKKNKGDCTQILEQIYEVLCGIICLHINSDTGGELPPKLLDDLGNFSEYLVMLF